MPAIHQFVTHTGAMTLLPSRVNEGSYERRPLTENTAPFSGSECGPTNSDPLDWLRS